MSTDAQIAIAIFGVAMVGTLGLGIAASRGRDTNVEEWSVGGRSFGVILTWVLLAGECYTSFSYLGAAGWAYGYGAPILYLVGYMATGYATVYLLAPMVWGYAKRHDLISVSDIISHRFKSRRFGLTVAFLAIYLPVKLFGGYGHLFSRLRSERPEWLTLPGHDSPGLGVLWFASTCVLNGVTFTVFPSFVAGYLGAKSPNTIRRNAIFLPLYSVLLLVPVMLGMAALFVVPNLETNDLALLTMVTRELPAWAVGIIGVAGALSAIVPMVVFMLCIGTLWGTGSVTTARGVVVASGLAALGGALLLPDAL